MPTYVTLLRWTDQGRRDVATLPDRVEQVKQRFEEMGGRLLGVFVTMGQYDQVALGEAPDDETMAKLAFLIAGRGNATTETLRCFSMDEVRQLLS
ncbi:GYD domain-containing protein [Thermoactinospora rubra]|uniref:GYD domain-containing protein n=1 Tax=Thermoactinospora rubra TaxID=1088767 RepID=UPI000A121CC6|nr:GYD domain-containing protein [Thermoactinospora rubra]